jgi:hypothetical protein
VRLLAEALAYAHKHSVVHRDVKPANVLLDEQGEPLLTDFGLAARPEPGEERLTQEAARGMGTPAYMAPEQAEGQAVPASDQYSLGCTLYELLTGRTPFAGPPELQIFLHKSEEPPRPRTLDRNVPRDLETICLKGLEKDPGRRYADCKALAEDLRRFQAGEVIRARRVGLGERLVRWCRREPRLAGAVGAAVALLLAVLVVLGVSARWQADAAKEQKRLNADLTSANDDLQQANAKANKALEDFKTESAQRERQYRMSLYMIDFNQALRQWEAHDLVATRQTLARLPLDLRGWEWDYLERQCQRKALTLKGHTGLVSSVAFSRDGKRLASGSYDKTVKVWDAATGQEILTLKGHTGYVKSVAFSPDGKRLASASDDQTVKVWDAATGQEPLILKGHTGGVYSVGFSPDGKRLASGNDDETVKVWDAATGQ